MQVKKQQLELDMEQCTSSKLEKEYIETVYCHPAYLTYMQSPSAVILEPKKIKSITVSTFSPYICHEVMGPDDMVFFFSF